MPPIDRKKSKRGPYKVQNEPRSLRDPTPLDDPQVAAFARALEKIKDPEKRACIAWLVCELARHKKSGG